MTKRVFRSIFLASLAVLLAAVVLILGALYTYFSDVQAEQLRLQTALVAHAWMFGVRLKQFGFPRL